MVAASRFLRYALLGPDYHFPEELSSVLSLTEHGESLRAEIRQNFRAINQQDISAALIAAFGADDQLLINADSSSPDKVLSILGKEIADRRLNYPLVFGRILHDQFIENFGSTPIESLTPEQTQQLVRLTPQGVFQIAEWVSGPYGLIRSAARRYLRPQTCGPVIRCSRIACNELHHIQMQTNMTDTVLVQRYILNRHPVSVSLSQQLSDILITDAENYRVNHPGALPWLLGNGFTQVELSVVAERILDNNLGGIREKANTVIGRRTARRSPAQIVGDLSHAALLQLLLLLDDAELVESLESAIEQHIIALSPTEVRRSFENRHVSGGYFKVDAEASSLGVRFVPTKQNMTEPRMLAVIRAVFAGDKEGALSWQLRNEPGRDSSEKLERCLEEQDPAELLNRILFSSQEALERAFGVLEYGLFAVPATAEAEKLLTEKMLWKMGSPLPTPKPAHASLDRHIARLMSATSREYVDEDARIIAIRDAGMSMFVELEELLRLTSLFACWSLLNDHFGMHPFERFRFSKGRAQLFSAAIFGAESLRRGASFPYDASLGNPLSVLIGAFRVLAEVCEARSEDEGAYLRPDWQVPNFSSHSDVQKFPLRHTSLFLDLHADSKQRLLATLRSVTLALTQTDICAVRNGLGHPRETFPNNERLVDAVQAIQSAISALAAEGLIPIVRKYAGEHVDKFERRRIRMADGSGDEVVLTAPNQLMMIGLPPYSVPQVVVKGASFVGSSQPARFEVADDSEWSETWHHVGFIGSWLNRAETNLVSEDVDVEVAMNEAPDNGAVEEPSERLY